MDLPFRQLPSATLNSRYFELPFKSPASSKIIAGLNFIFVWSIFDLFFRAILEGLRENSVLTDVELNISNNEVSVAVQIWLKLVMLTDKKNLFIYASVQFEVSEI